MSKNYTPYHIHSDISNAVTNIDSVTKFTEYIEKAKEYGMKAFGFSEHGSIIEWLHKKEAIEAAGMKYIHAAEVYLTETLDDKVKDNYHCVLIARNFAGVGELNKLISASFNRKDNHYYYVPRISFGELYGTSDNIIITTACVGGVLGRANETAQDEFLRFLIRNKHRVFIEIQHHQAVKQIEYNARMYRLSKEFDLELIAGTDTHALNETHVKGRTILQRSKNINFPDEEEWDLSFRSYDELVQRYAEQGVLPEEVYLRAIENTNKMADMVEEFAIDRTAKYPHIYDNPDEVFRDKVFTAAKNHPYIQQRYSEDEINDRLEMEIAAYKKTGSIDFMLLENYIKEWEVEHGIHRGCGRGSVTGSEVAYVLGITEMDSIKHKLNFFRFINPDRVSLADIDCDYANKDREKIKEFLLRDHLGNKSIKTCEIITLNTIALKGSCRDVARALNIPLDEVGAICDLIDEDTEAAEKEYGKKYPELFEYIPIVNGTIVSIGSHPCGVVVADIDVDEFFGTCSLATSDYPVSMWNMKELDSVNFVKLDRLGLDNVGVINLTCQYAGIDVMTPDNVDDMDESVWKSIRDDTTGIFQMESNSASIYIKKLFSPTTIERAKKKIKDFSYISWMSLGNGAIRPSGESFRESIAKGEFNSTGFTDLDKFLADGAGYVVYQEQIMRLLQLFCGYSPSESDTVRRAIAKKKGTESLLPEIRRRFLEYAPSHYNVTLEKAQEVIEPIIQAILDASSYGFSLNHSQAYSYIGYICGYLRYHYPLEFLTASLNVFGDNEEKTAAFIEYAKKLGIQIVQPRYGYSKSDYFFNKEKNLISRGVGSIKFLSSSIGDELYEISRTHEFARFTDLIMYLKNNTAINSRQIEILIKIDYFKDFGNQRELLRLIDLLEMFKYGEAKKITREKIDGTPLEPILSAHATCTNKKGEPLKSYTITDIQCVLSEGEDAIRAIHMDDISICDRAKSYYEFMGSADYQTGNPLDRNKLFVTEVRRLKSKSTGQLWAYSIRYSSLGSGISKNMTVYKGKFERDPIKVGDVIKCIKYSKQGIYLHLDEFEHVYQ